MNINDVESKLAQKLDSSLRNILRDFNYSLPENYRPQVSLLNAKGRKKKSNAAADNWAPESGERLEIHFEPTTEETVGVVSKMPAKDKSASSAISAAPSSTTILDLDAPEAELLRALDRAECRPGWSFVPLKKFRDEILPAEHSILLRTEAEQRQMLRSAIDKRFVLLGRVANPKSPQFPVTTIRLNRLMPEVKAALGRPAKGDAEFKPIEIPGEPLSATILRERR